MFHNTSINAHVSDEKRTPYRVSLFSNELPFLSFFSATRILILNKSLMRQSSLNCAPPFFFPKKWVTAKKISPVHYTSEPKPTDFCSLFLTTLKKNHIPHSSLLIAWPLVCGVQKKGGKACILKRSLAQSSFIMYIYANDTFDYSRKSLSLLLSLPSGQRFHPAVWMDEWQRTTARP